MPEEYTQCPHCLENIKFGATICRFCKETLNGGSASSKCKYCLEEIIPGAKICKHCGQNLSSTAQAKPHKTHANNGESTGSKSRIICISLAVILGAYGIHNFYTGYKKLGIIQAALGVYLLSLNIQLSNLMKTIYSEFGQLDSVQDEALNSILFQVIIAFLGNWIWSLYQAFTRKTDYNGNPLI